VRSCNIRAAIREAAVKFVLQDGECDVLDKAGADYEIHVHSRSNWSRVSLNASLVIAVDRTVAQARTTVSNTIAAEVIA
jgi:hypothetical protein